MIFIGERINTGFKDIKQAVMDKDPAPLQAWAKKQADAGAGYLDVNLGAVSADPSDMCWMIETVQDAVETPICIDTNKPKTESNKIDKTVKSKHTPSSLPYWFVKCI
ncbi:MAG: dihydropteroate synthase, partial [Phycisphaerae bacterium]|nr:dihydropteroate synthase [Phycisphaerae bacterium]